DVKVEIKSEEEEQTDKPDIEHVTFPAPGEIKLEATFDAVKNETKQIDIEEETTQNLVAPLAIKGETEDIKNEVTIKLVPILKTTTK
ncbi:hypothetical protein L9F63_004895, partial [Diploptera punctata]